VIFLLLLLSFNSYAIDIGDKAPDFKAQSLNGKRLSYYKHLRGVKPVYIVFWATWCLNCRRELPRVEKLYEKLGDRIEFIGINVGINERIEKIKKYVKEKNLNFTIIYDRDTNITRSFGVIGTPTNIIIDRKGVIRYMGVEVPEDIEGHMKELNR
jgi:peroxiredoxin